MRLHILTPSARPQLLAGISASIYTAQKHGWDINWYVFMKGPTHDYFAVSQINKFLHEMKDNTEDWFYILCDDNLIHPAMFTRTEEYIKAYPESRVLCWHIERHDNPGLVYPGSPETIKPGGIDASQVLIKCGSYGGLKWEPIFAGDGIFIKNLYDLLNGKFTFIPEILSYYEAAFWFMGGGEKNIRYVLENIACVEHRVADFKRRIKCGI